MERIDEKFDWNEIKGYGKGAIIGILLGLIVTPNQLRSRVYREYVKIKISSYLKDLKEYKKDDQLITAIQSVIKKVEKSNYITNKEDIINRINNVVYTEYESSHFISAAGGGDPDDNQMSYFYDDNSDKDYIMVNMKRSQSHKLLSYIHELNHLVDKHSITKENGEIVASDLLIDISNISRSRVRNMYVNYYKNWNDVKNGESSYGVGILLYHSIFGITEDENNTGGFVESNDKYFMSDAEIFARLSSMKSFMLKEGIISNIDERITKHHIELVRIYANKYKGDNYINDILELGFLYYLPLINWDKVDELNLIVNNSDSLYHNDLT